MLFNNLPVAINKVSKKISNEVISSALDNIGFILAKYLPCEVESSIPMYHAEDVVLPGGTTITIYMKERI